jgi:hypothetical protein
MLIRVEMINGRKHVIDLGTEYSVNYCLQNSVILKSISGFYVFTKYIISYEELK